MTRLPLREYIRDIEYLVAKNKSTYAKQHCKHLLRSFPKNVEVYRLLGKSCLDIEETGEAADVFQRVLSVIPDDFSALVGLGIVREDEGDLDSAIWFMEKALQVEFSNTEIQSEIRRLYKKRNETAPERPQITPGGLIRMYLNAHLYDQAISRAREALFEDPHQVDLQLLLARAYYLTGDKTNAGETCIQIINTLPYCLEANKILFILCSTMDRPAEAAIFQQRINEIDPYSAHVSRAYPSSALVPDETIQVERLDVPLKENELYFRGSDEPAAELMKILASPISPQEKPEEQKHTETPSNDSAEEFARFSSAPADKAAQKPAADIKEDQLPSVQGETGSPQIRTGASLDAEPGEPSLYEDKDIPDWLKIFTPSAHKPEAVSAADPQEQQQTPPAEPQEDFSAVAENAEQDVAFEENDDMPIGTQAPENSEDDAEQPPLSEQDQIEKWLKSVELDGAPQTPPVLTDSSTADDLPPFSFGDFDHELVQTPAESDDEDVPKDQPDAEPARFDTEDFQAQLRHILMSEDEDGVVPPAEDFLDDKDTPGDSPQSAD